MNLIFKGDKLRKMGTPCTLFLPLAEGIEIRKSIVIQFTIDEEGKSKVMYVVSQGSLSVMSTSYLAEAIDRYDAIHENIDEEIPVTNEQE